MEELYSVDPAAIRSLGVPVHGLIFLFKWGEEAAAVHRAQRVAAEKEASASSSSSDAIFFAAQVVPNACATQAILAVLLNRPEGEGSGSGLDLGHDLRELKAFAAGLDPESRGLALGGCERVRSAHAAFTPPVPIAASDDKEDGKDEAYHFISYVPCAADGALYELDGLAPGPRRLGGPDATFPPGSDGWLEAAAEAVQARIAAYSGAEIRFNLMAVVQDRRAVAAAAEAAAADAGDAPGAAAARDARAAADAAHSAWAAENERRRTNFVPFTLAALRHLAGAGQLAPFIAAAKEGAAEAAAQASGGGGGGGGGGERMAS